MEYFYSWMGYTTNVEDTDTIVNNLVTLIHDESKQYLKDSTFEMTLPLELQTNGIFEKRKIWDAVVERLSDSAIYVSIKKDSIVGSNTGVVSVYLDEVSTHADHIQLLTNKIKNLVSTQLYSNEFKMQCQPQYHSHVLDKLKVQHGIKVTFTRKTDNEGIFIIGIER